MTVPAEPLATVSNRPSIRRRSLYASAAVLIGIVGAAGALFAADFYLHHRFARSSGLNISAYRGPLVGSHKIPGERRVVAIGGSTTFGYGVKWDEAWPAELERHLGQPYRVVNLAYNNEGAYSYQFTLSDFASLNYDLAILYTGANDITAPAVPNRSVFRHESAIWRLTGYWPVLPTAARQLAMYVRYGGDMQAAYWSRKPVFRPSLPARGLAASLDAAVEIDSAVQRQLTALSPRPSHPLTDEQQGEQINRAAVVRFGSVCGPRWSVYCESMAAAFDVGLRLHKRILVVGEPFLKRHWGVPEREGQQRALESLISSRYSSVDYVKLWYALDLSDPRLSFDGMHPTAEGHTIVARRLAPFVKAVFEPSKPVQRVP